MVIFEWRPRPKWIRRLFPWTSPGGYTQVYETGFETCLKDNPRYPFYDPVAVQITNVDDSPISEILVWWTDGPAIGSRWWTSLQILQYDLTERRYRALIFFEELRFSEMGELYLDVLPGRGRVFVKYDAIWDFTDEWECHACKHRYRIALFQLRETRLFKVHEWTTDEKLSWDDRSLLRVKIQDLLRKKLEELNRG